MEQQKQRPEHQPERSVRSFKRARLWEYAWRTTGILGALALTALTVAHTALMPPQTLASKDFAPIEETVIWSLPLLGTAMLLGFLVGTRMQHDRVVLWCFVGSQLGVFVVGMVAAAAAVQSGGGDLPNHGEVDGVMTALGLSALSGTPVVAAALAVAAIRGRTTAPQRKALERDEDRLFRSAIGRAIWAAIGTVTVCMLVPSVLLGLISTYDGAAPASVPFAIVIAAFGAAAMAGPITPMLLAARRAHSIVLPAYAIGLVAVVGLMMSGILALPVMILTGFAATFSCLPGLGIPAAVVLGIGSRVYRSERAWEHAYFLQHHPGDAEDGIGEAPLAAPEPVLPIPAATEPTLRVPARQPQRQPPQAGRA